MRAVLSALSLDKCCSKFCCTPLLAFGCCGMTIGHPSWKSCGPKPLLPTSGRPAADTELEQLHLCDQLDHRLPYTISRFASSVRDSLSAMDYCYRKHTEQSRVCGVLVAAPEEACHLGLVQLSKGSNAAMVCKWLLQRQAAL